MLSVAFYFHKQNGICYYCKEPMQMGARAGWSRATRDHVIPRSKSRGYIQRNIVAACQFCNTHKGSLDKNEFLAILPDLIQKRLMTRSQRKIVKRERMQAADLVGRPTHRKDALRAARTDLTYAAKSTAWAEPLAALLNLEPVAMDEKERLARVAFAAWVNLAPDAPQIDQEWERIGELDRRFGGTSRAAWMRVAEAVQRALPTTPHRV